MTDTAANPSVLSFNEPEGLTARGTLIVVPGRGEKPAVYTRFGLRLAGDAYRVHVVTDPTRDPTLALEQVGQVALEAAGPVVLVGSDTGALFAVRLAAEGQVAGIAGLILAGLPHGELTDGGAAVESWEAELDARTTCPTHRCRISDRLVTRGALYSPVPAELSDYATLGQIELPILGVHGQDDPISPLERARESFLAAPHAELVSIAGTRHDVLNDQTHRTVAAITVLWLERLRADNGLTLIAHAEPAGATVA